MKKNQNVYLHLLQLTEQSLLWNILHLVARCDGGPTGIRLKSNCKLSRGNRWHVCYAFTSVPKLSIATSFLTPSESLPPLWHLLDIIDSQVHLVIGHLVVDGCNVPVEARAAPTMGSGCHGSVLACTRRCEK